MSRVDECVNVIAFVHFKLVCCLSKLCHGSPVSSLKSLQLLSLEPLLSFLELTLRPALERANLLAVHALNIRAVNLGFLLKVSDGILVKSHGDFSPYWHLYLFSDRV